MIDQRVQHMVCPCCAKMHGQEHIPTCPMVYDGPAEGVYETGWRAGSSYMRDVLVDVAERARERQDEAEALAGMLLMLMARGIVP